MFGDNIIMQFDDPASKDSSFRMEEKKTNLQLGITTINEERAKDGLGPVDWGQEPILQQQMIPYMENPIGEEKDLSDEEIDDLNYWMKKLDEDSEASEDLKD